MAAVDCDVKPATGEHRSEGARLCSASDPSASCSPSDSSSDSLSNSASDSVCKLVKLRTERAELDGVRLLLLSDTHDFHDGMKYDLPAADILVHAGDFTVRGTREETGNFQRWMESLLEVGTVKHVVVVAGNHELTFHDPASRSKHAAVIKAQEKVKSDLAQVPNLTYLEDAGCAVMGLQFYGTPWTLPVCGKMEWAFQARDLPGEEGVGQYFGRIPEGVDVLVSHSPPYGQGDEPPAKGKSTAGHGGSRVLLERVLTTQPLLHVFGHFHAGWGVSHHDAARTVFVNAATCDEDYHPDHPPIVVELEFAPPGAVGGGAAEVAQDEPPPL